MVQTRFQLTFAFFGRKIMGAIQAETSGTRDGSVQEQCTLNRKNPVH